MDTLEKKFINNDLTLIINGDLDKYVYLPYSEKKNDCIHIVLKTNDNRFIKDCSPLFTYKLNNEYTLSNIKHLKLNTKYKINGISNIIKHGSNVFHIFYLMTMDFCQC